MMGSKKESGGDALLQDVVEFSLDSKPCQPKAEGEAAGITNSMGIAPLVQESAASFGADSTSVNLAEGRPAFARPSR